MTRIFVLFFSLLIENLINDRFRQINDAENAATKIQSKARQSIVKNLKKDPEFKRRVQRRIEDRENEGKAVLEQMTRMKGESKSSPILPLS